MVPEYLCSVGTSTPGVWWKDKECNAEVSAPRALVEQAIAHFKAWRIFHTDCRRPYRTYHDAFSIGRGLFLFSLYEEF